MVITPYKRTPQPPTVAVLTADRTVISEHGRHLDFDNWPNSPGRPVRCWTTFDTVRQLIREGYGEAVCWNGEEIHWRHRQLDAEGWRNRPSDVHVLKLAEPEIADPLILLRAICRWRDWLRTHGAAPTGTTGSAAWSLLRAKLEHTLYTSTPIHSNPPIRWTVGGRQELGPAGKGVFEGRLELWDMPSAYANELGNLHYGGWWVCGSQLGCVDPEKWSNHGEPVFVQAKVNVPEMRYGPLPKRPARRPSAMLASMIGCEYPTDTTISGVWAWEELQAAVTAGCRIEKIREVFVHVSAWQPFLPWLEAIQDGRRMHGLAGTLAKMTGNALWGRFCMDSRGGARTIRSRGSRRMVTRPLVLRGGRPPAHDLAETVSGRVRSRLYARMVADGDRLVSAHTDGYWTRSHHVEEAGWRRKQRALRLELLSPQTLRYYPPKSDPVTVFAGVAAGEASEAFDKAWGEAGL